MPSKHVPGSLSVAIAAVLSGGLALPVLAAESGQSAAQLEEVVVTATKRAERLQDVPIAISAITADTLLTAGVQDFRDYATLVPGLTQRDVGIPGAGTIILRGMNTSAQQLTNTTAYYLDEAPFSANGFLSVSGLMTPSPDLGDVERIEVLKGPQGTLYGANSLGGLIRVISKAPDPTAFSGSVRTELSSVAGGDFGWSARGVLNVPIASDVAALRVSGGYRRAAGFVDNVRTGTENVNEFDVSGGRVALRVTPSERLTFDLVAFAQKIESVGGAFQDNVARTLRPLTRERAYSAVLDLESEIDYRLYSATADYDFGPVSWLTTVSYGKIESTLRSDVTRPFLPLVQALVPAGTGAVQRIGPNNEKRTVESRLTSDRLGRVEFIAGVFYTEEESEYPAVVTLLNPATGIPVTVPAGGALVRTGTLSDYEETSGFANVTFYFTDAIDFTGGVRHASSKDRSATGAAVDGLPATVFLAPRARTDFRSSSSPTTYLATLRWRPSETLSTYLRAASGFRPGGPQTNPAPPPGAQTQVTPDKVWSYEAGIKGAFLDGVLSFDASAYRIDWSDIQLPSLFNNIVLQGNAGEAKVDGFEATATLRPTESLTVNATAGYTDARITEISASTTASIGARKGDALPLTPEWTFALLADQQFQLSPTFAATVGGTIRAQAKAPTSYPGAVSDPNVVLPGYTTVDLRAGLSWDRYVLQLRAENLLDKLAFTGTTLSGTVTQATMIRPRTVTLSLSAAF